MSRLNLWYLPPAFFFAGGPWGRPAPGIPCALYRGRRSDHPSDAKRAARTRTCAPMNGDAGRYMPSHTHDASASAEVVVSQKLCLDGSRDGPPAWPVDILQSRSPALET